MLWLFFINITGSVGIAGYWSEIIFIISLTENIVFVKFFETPFGSNIIASFTEFQCQGTNVLVLFECKLLKFTFEKIFYINKCMVHFEKVE